MVRARLSNRSQSSGMPIQNARISAWPAPLFVAVYPGQDRALAPDDEERGEAGELLLPMGARGCAARLRRVLQQRALPRSARQRDAGGCVLRPAVPDPLEAREDQTTYDAGAKATVPIRKGRLGEN